MATSESTPKNEPEGKKRRWLRPALLLLFFTFIVMQFFQPDKNNNDVLVKNDISSVVPVPDTVHQLLKAACYDCHSNNTEYPWYINIQPVGWWMDHHIDEGKHHLNFNEFANIPARNGKTSRERQAHLMEEIKEQIDEDEMPLDSYLLMHEEARLSKTQKKIIVDWTESAQKTIAKDGK